MTIFICHLPDAVRLLELATRLDRYSASAYANLGIAQLGLGHRREAARAFRRALKLKPENEKYRSLLETAQEKTSKSA